MAKKNWAKMGVLYAKKYTSLKKVHHRRWWRWGLIGAMPDHPDHLEHLDHLDQLDHMDHPVHKMFTASFT